MNPAALTVAGSDPSGGAGLQSDLKVFQQLEVYGMSVVTLLTVQNTQTVSAVHNLDVRLVLDQLDAVLDDIPPAAAKTGALGSADLIRAFAERAAKFPFPLVVDPVMVSKHGVRLVDDESAIAIRDALVPNAHLITPNMFEAAQLLGEDPAALPDLEDAAQRLHRLGARNVLIKGPQRAGGIAVDVLLHENQCHYLRAPSIETRCTHGTGCVYSAAITAYLAKGESVLDSVMKAKAFVAHAIRQAEPRGRGLGPIV